ncbi:unnamed protein product [Callosobruchus maculatus]|nr:unnamed protein product [Callosobruchus maculatus]
MSTFEDGPWQQMTKDFSVLDGNIAIYDKFNIAWIKKKSNSKLFKAPFLAAIIQSYEITDGKVPTVNVTLQDRTGCIQATLLHSLYEEKVDYLTTGSVLVLKSFGVLCAQNSYCLTITQNNLLRIYSLQTKKIDSDKRTSVENIIIQDLDIKEILRNYHEPLVVTKNSCDSKTKRISNTRIRNAEATDPLCRDEANELNIPSVKPVSCIPSNECMQKNSNIIHASFESVRSSSCSNEMSSAKTFNFKKPVASNVTNSQRDVGNSFSQISVKTDKSEHTEIWKNLLEDVDAESLFSDF